MIWVLFYIINNTLKVPQNSTPGKLLFSRRRPRWPPQPVDGYIIMVIDRIRSDELHAKKCETI